MEIENLYITVGDETYINIPSLYTLNADVYIVFGERSAGKTYSVFKGLFDDYNATGAQFVYMRTREDYLIRGRAWGAVANIKPYVEKTLWKEEANLNYYSGVYRKQELGRNNKWVYSPCGYSSSIASWMKYKGNGYDSVKTIFFDEFIEDVDTTTIIPLSRNEFLKGYSQQLSTIVRRRKDVKIVACANSINPKSPLFDYYNIDARKLEQGKVYIFNRKLEEDNLKICVLYTEPPKKAHVSKHLAVYESQTNDMTINGAWQEEVYPDIYNHLSWKWYAELSNKSNRIYIADFAITVIYPTKQGIPLIVIDGKYKAKATMQTNELYLPIGQRLIQWLLYYKRTSQICASSKNASEKFNDLIKRVLIDKN
jgi:hypothetical protein|nr:MAG TPA: Terminase [Caudoviricetes sp.]